MIARLKQNFFIALQTRKKKARKREITRQLDGLALTELGYPPQCYQSKNVRFYASWSSLFSPAKYSVRLPSPGHFSQVARKVWPGLKSMQRAK